MTSASPSPISRVRGRGSASRSCAGGSTSHVTLRLLDGVRRGLAGCGVLDDDVVEVWVPGAFEIPLAAKTYAATGRWRRGRRASAR